MTHPGRNDALPSFNVSADILDKAPVGMVLVDRPGRVLWSNEAGSRILGRPPGALAGSAVEAFMPREAVEVLVETEQALSVGSDGHVEREVRWTRPDGAGIWVQVSASRATDANGMPLQLGRAEGPLTILQFVDITDRRAAQAKLIEAHRLLEQQNADLQRSNDELAEFAYVVSHDLSEPLRVITGHVQLLASRYRGQLDGEADSWIAFAVDGCARMRALIDDLLRYSRAGRDQRPFVDVDSQAVVERALAELGIALRESGASVSVSGGLPVVRSDPFQLGQVFTNLVGNSIKFQRDGVPPQITISAETTTSGWVFTVADNGVGVPPRHRERVFKLFQRLSRDYPGTGLGLGICRKIVQRHGGAIWVEDSETGGAAFRFSIPTKAQEP